MPGWFSFNSSVIPLCEIGMGDPRAAEPSSWLDVSCYVHEAELFRGRERFNDHFEPGTASITLKNDNGWADLTGDSTAVVDRPVRPGRHIRIGVVGPWDGGPVLTRWLFRGFIDQTQPAYDPVAEDVVTFNCIDAFGEAGLPELLGHADAVGVNETVDARINRALDEVGWWSAKRSIAAGTAQLQGVTMAGRATDTMTTAADSAGGVVFGDVVGNVVYRDLDWMLYDPDTPPDGEIGNCDPGVAPVPPVPPYFDPTPGPVEVVDGIPDHPAQTYFCLGPSETGGRVIEHGEAYELLVAKGPDGLQHLYLIENGHRYDLRVWEPEGGCVTVTHPGPGGEPPTSKGCLPDVDCIPIGSCEIGVDPDCTAPPELTWNVEFIGYSDGGLADGPQSTVTVSGLTPGPGVMLVVLINAICNAIPSGSLLPPTITGAAGMTFSPIGSAIAGGDGVESFGAVTRTPRDDPGTFDINVTWAGGHQSREHIVTVWKLTLERPDLFDRMAAGQYIRAFSWDRVSGVLPSPYNPPGKGFAHVELSDPSSDVPPYPSRVDVVIAQSLADSPNPPFGASFDASNGPWWTPAFADVPTTGPGAVFHDDFERPDGPLGADWATPTGAIDAVVVIAPVIASGVAVNPTASGWPDSIQRAVAHYVNAVPGDHYIEAEIVSFEGPGNFVGVLAHFDPATYSGVSLGFRQQSPTTGNLELYTWSNGEGFNFGVAPSITTPTVLRLESTATGHHSAFADGELLLETDWTEGGEFVGIVIDYGLGTLASPGVEWVDLGGAGIVRKCSWVAGYRPVLPLTAPVESTVSWVEFDEVNFGPDNLQSSQCAVVVSPLSPDTFGWRVLANYASGPTSPTLVPPTTRSSSVRYERNSMIVVFVSAFAGSDITAGINVSSSAGLTFARSVNQGKTDPLGHAQGAVFTAKTPAVLTPSDTISVSWGASLEGVSYLVMEVTNAEAVGATGSAVRGTHGVGSVDGSVTVLLSATTADTSVVLGLLGVLSAPTEAGGIPGTGWIQEVEYFPASPNDHTWYLAESNAGVPQTAVTFNDMMDSTTTGPKASDAVVLGIEITPGPDFVNWELESGSPVSIGGTRDAFTGAIYEAGQTYPSGGWLFNPGDHV